jgi:hypothetical protein
MKSLQHNTQFQQVDCPECRVAGRSPPKFIWQVDIS